MTFRLTGSGLKPRLLNKVIKESEKKLKYLKKPRMVRLVNTEINSNLLRWYFSFFDARDFPMKKSTNVDRAIRKRNLQSQNP
jgi:hypothetical protein